MKYYLGIDLSTQKIGISVLNEKKEIQLCECLKLKTIDSLEKRASIFKLKIEQIAYQFNLSSEEQIEKVFIEEPFISFQGGSTAKTVATLQTFNGMARASVYFVMGLVPILLNPNKVRGILGIKIDRKKKKPREKKQPILDFVSDYFKNSLTPFTYELTKHGNFKPGEDDRADSLCLILAGLCM